MTAASPIRPDLRMLIEAETKKMVRSHPDLGHEDIAVKVAKELALDKNPFLIDWARTVVLGLELKR